MADATAALEAGSEESNDFGSTAAETASSTRPSHRRHRDEEIHKRRAPVHPRA